MKIYFATHATTKDNEAGTASGWKDIDFLLFLKILK
jgi:broad specificity phosphatase PhoE